LVTSDPFIRFYAGAQLVTHDHFAIGTLCIIDMKPRQFLDVDVKMLSDLATIAMNEIELKGIKGQNTQPKRFTNRDAQTSAYNERSFRKLFPTECARAQGNKAPLSLAVFGLDQLMPETNDPDFIDGVAKSFRDSCKEVIRSGDILARVSEKEFALLLPNTKSESAEIVVRRALRRINNSVVVSDNSEIAYSASAGVAELARGQRPSDFYREAERNRRSAEQSGRNKYVASFAA
jgi:diguanylate cyclase (GGDEF)-like protein